MDGLMMYIGFSDNSFRPRGSISLAKGGLVKLTIFSAQSRLRVLNVFVLNIF